jgi:hypothetical protein
MMRNNVDGCHGLAVSRTVTQIFSAFHLWCPREVSCLVVCTRSIFHVVMDLSYHTQITYFMCDGDLTCPICCTGWSLNLDHLHHTKKMYPTQNIMCVLICIVQPENEYRNDDPLWYLYDCFMILGVFEKKCVGNLLGWYQYI